GMRVVFEAEHEPGAHGAASHRIIRTAAPDLALELVAAGASWPSALADALITAGSVAAADFRPTDAGLAARLGDPTKLHSWIIAPRSAIRREICYGQPAWRQRTRLHRRARRVPRRARE